MVVSVTGKNASRVQQIFSAGAVVYNGYRYWWDGFASNEDEIAGLLALFPDDDSARVFNSAEVTAVSLESGGGAQRSLVGIARPQASAKKLFRSRSPWEILLKAPQDLNPRHERDSYSEHPHCYPVHLSFYL